MEWFTLWHRFPSALNVAAELFRFAVCVLSFSFPSFTKATAFECRVNAICQCMCCLRCSFFHVRKRINAMLSGGVGNEDFFAFVFFVISIASHHCSVRLAKILPRVLFPRMANLQRQLRIARNEIVQYDSPASFVQKSKGERLVHQLEKQLGEEEAKSSRIAKTLVHVVPTVIRFGFVVPAFSLYGANNEFVMWPRLFSQYLPIDGNVGVLLWIVLINVATSFFVRAYQF
jgi:hypothetical protein